MRQLVIRVVADCRSIRLDRSLPITFSPLHRSQIDQSRRIGRLEVDRFLKNDQRFIERSFVRERGAQVAMRDGVGWLGVNSGAKESDGVILHTLARQSDA